eukprot:6736853-Karenia_brevis.AAC.1
MAKKSATDLKTERKTARVKKGRLRDNILKPSTLDKDRKAAIIFVTYLDSVQETRPEGKHSFDRLACDFLETLWEEGDSKNEAGTT